jgi:hypothetical protein
MTFEILQARSFPVYKRLEIRNIHSRFFHKPQCITRISTENFVPMVAFALYLGDLHFKSRSKYRYLCWKFFGIYTIPPDKCMEH